MSKSSKSSEVNKQFVDRVKPVMESWGLSKHPNPTSYFGRSDYGYRYDFADWRNEDEIKIAAFSILNPGPSLWVKGFRTNKFENSRDLPIIFDSMKGVFTLTRKWSALRPLSVRFEFHKKNQESLEEPASRLIDDVIKELPKLQSYLYS